MTKHPDKTLTKGERQWLWLRSAALPLAALLPYFIVRQKGCDFPETMPCIVRGQPSFVPQLLVWGLITALALLAYRQRAVEVRERRKVFVRTQFWVSLGVAAVTMLAYVYIRRHSQAANFMSYSRHPALGFPEVSQAWFGLGIAPATLWIISLIYLANPFYRWYATFHSPKHVEGIKKEKLFK